LIEEDYGEQLALSVGRDLMMYLAGRPNEEMRPHDCASQPIDRFGGLVAWSSGFQGMGGITVQPITKDGAVRGTLKGLWRILRCNPFCRGGFDPP
jgi:hypothetical protein